MQCSQLCLITDYDYFPTAVTLYVDDLDGVA
jgi:hypothetical protein